MDVGEQTRRHSERRHAPRFAYRTGLKIEWGSATLLASTANISASGMFIESHDPLWVGAGFSATLNLESPLHVDCFVKRIEPGRGMGVTVSVPAASQERYQDLLLSLSTSGR
jgi:hypothetical protein